MDLTLTEGQNQIRLTLSGDIDAAGATRLAAVFRQLEGRGAAEIVLDLGDVSHIGNAGAGLVLSLYQDATRKGGEIRIERSSPTVRDLLRLVLVD